MSNAVRYWRVVLREEGRRGWDDWLMLKKRAIAISA